MRCTRPGETRAIGEWALEHGVWAVTDEIYKDLLHDGVESPSTLAVVPEQVIVLDDVVKTYAMTGWRVAGWWPRTASCAPCRICSRTCPATSPTSPSTLRSRRSLGRRTASSRSGRPSTVAAALPGRGTGRHRGRAGAGTAGGLLRLSRRLRPAGP
ncbi:aminotransferase class I/II-fold pyridoxal phosphate-dependent enzyme [Streptomyces sp. NBC_01618]|uniref:aminotransferase class I/II-fold pyridoxal phosphate-dependent enzyme n=1 Tax=Streptomyces sp. NBC_01618 TaxID=2975900 RepID=UPI00386EFA3A